MRPDGHMDAAEDKRQRGKTRKAGGDAPRRSYVADSSNTNTGCLTGPGGGAFWQEMERKTTPFYDIVVVTISIGVLKKEDA